MLLIHASHICCSLAKILCNPKISSCGSFLVICRHVHRGKKVESPLGHVAPAEFEQSGRLSSRFGSHPINECLFRGLATVTSVAFLCFALVILLFEVPPPPIVLKG